MPTLHLVYGATGRQSKGARALLADFDGAVAFFDPTNHLGPRAASASLEAIAHTREPADPSPDLDGFRLLAVDEVRPDTVRLIDHALRSGVDVLSTIRTPDDADHAEAARKLTRLCDLEGVTLPAVSLTTTPADPPAPGHRSALPLSPGPEDPG